MSKQAFAYLRVSGKGQVDGDGFPRQLQAVTEYAAAHGIKIMKVFREEGVSGTKAIEQRPQFVEMLTALRTGKTQVVLIECLNRLARDLMMQETIIGNLRKGGFKLLSVAEPDLCSDDPSRVMVRQLFGVVAQYEKSTLVAKLRGARERKRAATGRCEGRKPYGARPGEFEVIARMKSLRAAGTAWATIAQTLNDDCILARAGSWYANSVRRVVTGHQ
jgi:DNA invertase Pin-like site-specific DNA recombinase